MPSRSHVPRRVFRRTFPRLAAAAAALAIASCGPSFQAIYEGDARFEKCYALDESPNAPLEQKGSCWQDWSKRYTYGQTRDRIEYAVARYRALSRVPELPTDEAIMQAAPGGGANPSSVSAPAPTSAFAPPPGTLSQDAGAPLTAMPLPQVEAPAKPPQPVMREREPGADCTTECGATWRACRETCQAAACDTCERDYRKCARACFKEDPPKQKGTRAP